VVTTSPDQQRELQIANRFYEQLIESIPIQLAVFDPDGRYRYVSPTAIADPVIREWIIGKTNAEYVQHRGFPASVGALRDAVTQEAVRTGHLQSFEETLRAVDGVEHRILRHVVPIFDSKGALQHILGFGIDVSERAAVEASLRAANVEAARLVAAKERFLANISHEIRTPLNGVIGTADVLSSLDLTADQQQCVDTIRFAAQSLFSVVNDVLDFSKFSNGAVRFESAPMDVRGLCESTLRLFEPQISDLPVVLRIKVDPSLPTRLTGDPARLQQVLSNLVSNAVKFTPKGSVTIRLKFEPALDQATEGQLNISIEDTGIGIPALMQQRLFQPFSQAEDTTSRQYGGTGLGLAIVHEIVTHQGGTVRVESAEGEGSTFTVVLPSTPLSPDVEAAVVCPAPAVFPRPALLALFDAPAPSTESDVPEGRLGLQNTLTRTVRPPCSGPHVLVVEDNNLNRFVARRLLELAGMQVSLAVSGEEALTMLDGHLSPDVVLMDLQMPGLDGFETTRRLRQSHRREVRCLPVIALTADALDAQRVRAMSCGMQGFLTKPVAQESLADAIYSAITQAESAGNAVQRRTPYTTQPETLSTSSTGRALLDIERPVALGLNATTHSVDASDLYQIFLTTLSGSIEEIRLAIAAADATSVLYVSHRLRSGAASVGADQLVDELRDLDTAPLETTRWQALERVVTATSAAAASYLGSCRVLPEHD